VGTIHRHARKLNATDRYKRIERLDDFDLLTPGRHQSRDIDLPLAIFTHAPSYGFLYSWLTSGKDSNRLQ
jgi:hypothetical protein